MKRLLFSLLLLPALILCGCADEYPSNDKEAERIAGEINKNATWELGFLEDAEGKDLSSLVKEIGWEGADGYYNHGFKEGDEHYVFYLISAYPDYADKRSAVTRIECTDPAVTFFGGCTVENCEELFLYLSGEGFEIINSDDFPGSVTSATKGNIRITHDSKSQKISFYYEVSNRDGIIF